MRINALMKDTIRDIKKSIGRFTSILAIVALGVAFFSGVKVSPQDMKITADKYYDDYNLMDIRIVSTLGLTQSDVDEIKKVPGVNGVSGNCSMDVLAEFDSKEVVLKVHGLSLDKLKNNHKDYINRVNLIEGRLPERSGECVIEKGKSDDLTIPIGSTIRLYSGTDKSLSEDIKKTEYKVVGKVQTPYYLSSEKGSSAIGNGKIKSFIMIPQEDFKMPAYTEIFATVNGAKGLNSYKDDYFNVVDKVTKDIENLAKSREEIRHEEVLKKAKDDLEKGRKEYLKGRKETEEKLNKASKEIEDSKVKINNSEKDLNDKERTFNISIKEAEDKIAKGEEDLSKGEDELQKNIKTFNDNKKLAEEGSKKAEEELAKGQQSIQLLEGKIVQLQDALKNPGLSVEEKNKLQSELQTTIGMLQETKDKVAQGKMKLEEKKAQLAEGEKKLNNSKAFLISSRTKLEKEKLNLQQEKSKALAGFKDGRDKIESGKKDLLKGEEEYKNSKAEADKELSKAKNKIDEGEKALEKIKKPKWYVLDRKSHYSYMDYGGAADRIDALARVFPVFFVLVAALVCLTTMTRMVDEQRVNIGTLKALGYGKGAIASKYICYALAASTLGCIIGLAIGFTIFPTVVFNAYGIMYMLPPVVITFDIPLAVTISSAAILVTTLSAFFACYKELIEAPSALMLPRAPKEGKRILLERIPFIWNRLNFSGKVTVRNIFRYKKRFLMTVLGIAGCTALIVTGFGVRDSIRTIVDKQFGVIFTYDMTVNLDKKANEKERNEALEYISKDNRISGYELINSESGSLSLNGQKKSLSIIVPKDIKDVENFIHLQTLKKGSRIPIPSEGVVITEKVAKDIGAKVGDEIKLINSEDKEAKVKITGIAENYLFNYAYISQDYYEELFLQPVEFNEVIASLKDTSKDFEDKLSRELIKEKGISNASFNTAIKENFENTIRSLNYVVLMMIVSAGALAFVVLYNLTNVNISERIREIATIKVLGFYDNEVSAYIYRENTILTLIGTAAGLVMGVFLHKFIMTTVEMDNMIFGLTIDIKSYIISTILTLVFAVLVNIAMYYKLKNIEMVESLKTVD
ncbi:outer membrane-specific lipoprotein transporter subunit LolE [Clostridium liquoris]|uniref:Outer membrane-specific lipoprotein transporter subunit LolE n=1 Tax=Clostridium liquoris TaxID=1289519 RepID=A0A2T0B2H7_9CLOT|nr:outer membrane-specific lipoprotein transporter subunit LolE [Clostridium liquoris]